jgi:hypothetical protein
MDKEKVAASFAFDPEQVAALRTRWLELLDLAVWGDLKSARIGAVPRLRKRLLELGEHLRSLVSDRTWIPQPREQVKGAMGASLNLRESLLNLERAAVLLEGGADFPQFEQGLLDFRGRLLTLMERHEALWGDLLESQYREDDAPEG